MDHVRDEPAVRGTRLPLAVLGSSVALFGILLAGCGAGSSTGAVSTGLPATSPASPQALAAVAGAVTQTLGLTSAFDMKFKQASANAAAAAPRDGSGSFDFRSPSGTIRLQLPGPGNSEHMVFLPGTVFIDPPPSSPPLQPGRPWIFANFADIAKYNVNFPPYIVQTENINPAFTLDELAWGAAKSAPAGQVTFDGAPATMYVVTVDLNQALARAAGSAGSVFTKALSSEISALGGGTSSTPVSLHIDAWVDKKGRLVGARVTPPGAGLGTITIALSHFGSSVQATKPARSTVVDIAAMIPGGEQEALNGGDSDGA